MIKTVGAAWILLGTLLSWMVYIRERARRHRALTDLCTALFRFGEEIRSTRAPLPVLLEDAALSCGNDAAEFFRTVSNAARTGENFITVWRTESERLPLDTEECRRLSDLSADLRGDAQQAGGAVRLTGEYFSERLTVLERSARTDTRTMAALVFSGGVLLIILLY